MRLKLLRRLNVCVGDALENVRDESKGNSLLKRVNLQSRRLSQEIHSMILESATISSRRTSPHQPSSNDTTILFGKKVKNETFFDLCEEAISSNKNRIKRFREIDIKKVLEKAIFDQEEENGFRLSFLELLEGLEFVILQNGRFLEYFFREEEERSQNLKREFEEMEEELKEIRKKSFFILELIKKVRTPTEEFKSLREKSKYLQKLWKERMKIIEDIEENLLREGFNLHDEETVINQMTMNLCCEERDCVFTISKIEEICKSLLKKTDDLDMKEIVHDAMNPEFDEEYLKKIETRLGEIVDKIRRRVEDIWSESSDISEMIERTKHPFILEAREDGSKIFRQGIRVSQFSRVFDFDEQGRIRFDGYFLDGKKEGRGREFRDGKLEYVGEFKDGVRLERQMNRNKTTLPNQYFSPKLVSEGNQNDVREKLLKRDGNVFISEGRNGVVYKSTSLVDNEIVAVKRIYFHKNEDRKKKIEFMKDEIRIQLLLSEYDEVGKVHGWDLDNAMCGYIIQDFHQKTLDRKAIKKMTCKRMIQILRGIAVGMEKINDLGVVHGDLKCDNVLLSGDGSVRIIDFGHSFFLEDMDNNSKAPWRFGTPGWLAPEGWKRKGSRWIDVYSFGKVMKEFQLFSSYTTPGELWKRGEWEREKWFFSLQRKCLRTIPQLRPTFFEIVEEIEKHL